MADAVRGTFYPIIPGNCPDAGYKLVSKQGFVEPPLTGENLEWTKDTAITEADKAQIIANKNNITTLQGQVETLEEEIEDVPTDVYTKSEVDTKLADKQDKLIAGSGITIAADGKTISATGGGGGFTPTQAQLDAMNSGIDSTKVGQIATNADDIDQLETDLADKVDKVAGKGLSTNDYTTADQTKVGYIGNGVETLTFTLADSSTVTLKVVKGA